MTPFALGDYAVGGATAMRALLGPSSMSSRRLRGEVLSYLGQHQGRRPI